MLALASLPKRRRLLEYVEYEEETAVALASANDALARTGDAGSMSCCLADSDAIDLFGSIDPASPVLASREPCRSEGMSFRSYAQAHQGVKLATRHAEMRPHRGPLEAEPHPRCASRRCLPCSIGSNRRTTAQLRWLSFTGDAPRAMVRWLMPLQSYGTDLPLHSDH